MIWPCEEHTCPVGFTARKSTAAHELAAHAYVDTIVYPPRRESQRKRYPVLKLVDGTVITEWD